MKDRRIDLIRSRIRDIPDFPKPGILFKDITPILSDPEAFSAALDLLQERLQPADFDTIVGIESRGFIFGGALAHKTGKRFVPARKPGKLPYKTVKVEYALEYGSDSLEIHEDAISTRNRVLVLDDLLATGGTAAGTARLVTKLGGQVVGIAFVIELGFLNGADRLKPFEHFSLITF